MIEQPIEKAKRLVKEGIPGRSVVPIDLVSDLLLEIRCLSMHVADRGKSYKDKVKDNEKLKATLKEVAGCQTDHGTEKLCDGCLISIASALGE